MGKDSTTSPPVPPGGTPLDAYELLIRNMLNGVAYCRMKYDDTGEPEDFLYLMVNRAFEEQTGLQGVAGRWVSEVIPGIREADPDLFHIYGRVARSGVGERFETHLQALDAWFDVSVFSPRADEFVAVFDVVTERKRAELALQRSRTQLSRALRLSRAGQWEYDVATDTFTFNDHFYEVYRTSAAEVGGYTMRAPDYAARFCHPDDAHRVAEEIRMALEAEDPDYQRRIQHKVRFGDGSEGHVAVSIFLEKNAEGRTTKTLGINQDITAYIDQQESHRATAEMLREILRASRAGAWTWDMKSGHIVWTEELYSIFGLQPDAPAGFEAWRRILHPDDLAGAEQRIKEAIETHRSLESEYRILRPDGEVRWISALGKAHYDAEGLPTSMLGICLDMTEKRRVEFARHDSEERLAFALEKSQTGGWDLDLISGVAYRTKELARIFGYPSAESPWSFDAFRQHVLPEDRDRVEATIKRAIEEPSPLEFVCRIRRVDGEVRWVNVSGGVRIDLEGRPTRLAGIIHDVTEVRRAREESEALEAQVQHLQRMESIGRLAGGVAHDMNNVLGAILGVAALIQERGGDMARQADVILRACMRGRNLVKSLMDFARKDVQEKCLIDLGQLVTKEAELLERTTLQRIQLKVEINPDLPKVWGSETTLSNALMNLCVNALDAMPEGGRLTLRLFRRSDEEVALQVEDTGEGMPPEVLERAMEPFYTTKPFGKGTGLGLSIVYGTIQAHGGTVSLASRPGSGTCVTVTLPAARESASVSAGLAADPQAAVGRKLRILLVDDDAMMRMVGRELLELMGHTVSEASGGLEALRLLSHWEAYDAVLLDRNMPGMDGVETLKRLRDLGCTLPVVISSGYMDEAIECVAREFGGVRLLPKPYTVGELRTALG